jgi:hypothetical protein
MTKATLIEHIMIAYGFSTLSTEEQSRARKQYGKMSKWELEQMVAATHKS